MNELSFIKAALLGALQGATEFLPVSSSGHLVIAQQLLGVRLEGGGLLAFDVCLHFGTLLAVVAVFWRDLIFIFKSFTHRIAPGESTVDERCGLTARQARRLGFMIILGTIPAAVVGLSLHDFFDKLMSRPLSAAAMLLVTGTILWLTRWAKGRGIDMSVMKWWQALVIGLAQAAAIIPGISRSGSTIATGLYLGLDRGLAARFSFLLAVPAIAGATVIKLGDLANFSPDILVATILGTVVAAVVGFACIKWLLSLIRHGRFWWFAFYCWAAGLAAIIYVAGF